jgi:hypothetical protein
VVTVPPSGIVTGALDVLGVAPAEGAGELAALGDAAARISAIACAVTSSASRAVA